MDRLCDSTKIINKTAQDKGKYNSICDTNVSVIFIRLLLYNKMTKDIKLKTPVYRVRKHLELKLVLLTTLTNICCFKHKLTLF